MEQTLLSPVAGLSPNNGELSAVRGGGGGWGGGAPRDPHEVIHFEPRSSCRERHLKLPFDFLLMIKKHRLYRGSTITDNPVITVADK